VNCCRHSGRLGEKKLLEKELLPFPTINNETYGPKPIASPRTSDAFALHVAYLGNK
jgi:hypothetical protein